MRDLTARTSFWLRKKLDTFLHFTLGWKWVPLYTSVTFSRMRYHLCVENKKWQDEVRHDIQQASHITLPRLVVDQISYINEIRLVSAIFGQKCLTKMV